MCSYLFCGHKEYSLPEVSITSFLPIQFFVFVKFYIHRHIVPRLRRNGGIPPLLQCAIIESIGKILPFCLIKKTKFFFNGWRVLTPLICRQAGRREAQRHVSQCLVTRAPERHTIKCFLNKNYPISVIFMLIKTFTEYILIR